MSAYRAGVVSIVGRPNVGKSTLMNHLIGHKLSITSRRAQTTRHRILGIKTHETGQLVYVDTPGMHGTESGVLGRYMNRAVTGALVGVDCVVVVVAASGIEAGDERVFERLKDIGVPIVLVINKIDLLKRREDVLPLIEFCQGIMDFAGIIPVSAQHRINLDELESLLFAQLPEQGALYPEDQLTDKSERFVSAELVREQIFRGIGQEVPYSVAVEIERFEEKSEIIHIDALIWVEKPGQKAIIIGKQGARLKRVGIDARKSMEQFFAKRVNLKLWVKVREGWSDSERALRSLGYGEEDH